MLVRHGGRPNQYLPDINVYQFVLIVLYQLIYIYQCAGQVVFKLCTVELVVYG